MGGADRNRAAIVKQSIKIQAFQLIHSDQFQGFEFNFLSSVQVALILNAIRLLC